MSRPKMFQAESLPSSRKFQTARVGLPLLCLVAFLALLLPASAQTPGFTLTMAPFPPPAAIEPGGTDGANLALDTVNGFTGEVTLGCQVTVAQTQQVVTSPSCTVSPTTVTPPGGASITITSVAAPTGRYVITVTGTAPSAAPQSASQELSVLPEVPQFTITVGTVVAPTSVPAGNSAKGVVNVNPIFGYTSTAGVTLSCSTIRPLVVIPPICSFTPNPVPVIETTAAVSQLTITTYGPVPAGAARRGFSAVWLPLPMLALAGLGAAAGGKKSRRAWGLLALFIVSGSFLLVPACGTSPNGSTTPNGITPANSYVFTVIGVDATGLSSSNTTSTSSAPTVSLAVTAPTTN